MDNENISLNSDDTDFEDKEKKIINKTKFRSKIPSEINEEAKDYFEETTKSKSNQRRFICNLCATRKVTQYKVLNFNISLKINLI